jgi:hypothetical protein
VCAKPLVSSLKENMLKKCTKCGVEKDIELFSRDKYKSDGRRCHCKECNKEEHLRRYEADAEGMRAYSNEYRKRLRESNPEKLRLADRNTKLKRAYGLNHEQVEEMKRLQDYRCYTCGKHESEAGAKGLVVDHNHTTGKVRRLLCSACNTSLGLTKEDVGILASLIKYLEEHKDG